MPDRIKVPGGDVEIALADPLLQRHMEKFSKEQRRLAEPLEENGSPWEVNGNFLRAAITAEIVTDGLTLEDVETMNPGHVQWLAMKLDEWMAKHIDIPKN